MSQQRSTGDAIQLSFLYCTFHLMLESHWDAPPPYDKPSAAEGVSSALDCALGTQRDLAKARKIVKQMDEKFSLRIHEPLRDAENKFRCLLNETRTQANRLFMKLDQFLKRTVTIIAKSDNYDSTRLHHLSLATRQVVEDIDSEHTDDVFDEDVDKLAAILRRLASMTRDLVETAPFQGQMCSSINRCPPVPTDIACEITIQRERFDAICKSIVSPVRTLSLWRQGVGEIITTYRRTTPILNSARVSIRDIRDTGDIDGSDISDDDDFHSARSSPSPSQSSETLELEIISRHEITETNYLELKNEVDNLVTVIDSIIEKLEKWKSALRVFDTIWEKLKRDATDLGDHITGNSLEDQEMVAMTLDQAGVYQRIMDRLDDFTLRLS